MLSFHRRTAEWADHCAAQKAHSGPPSPAAGHNRRPVSATKLRFIAPSASLSCAPGTGFIRDKGPQGGTCPERPTGWQPGADGQGDPMARGDATRNTSPISTHLEEGARRTFAVAVDRPGWARSGRTAEAAAATRPRIPAPPGSGVSLDHRSLTPDEAERQARLVGAAWNRLDEVAAGAPARAQRPGEAAGTATRSSSMCSTPSMRTSARQVSMPRLPGTLPTSRAGPVSADRSGRTRSPIPSRPS